VGKSDYGQHAKSVIHCCCFYDLDDLVSRRSGMPAAIHLLFRIRKDSFLQCCMQEVDAITDSCTQGIAVVAVGAGALESCRASVWLSAYPDPTIAVYAQPDEVYKRGGWRNQNRSIEKFKETEYSPYRQSLYRNAKYQCDVTELSLDQARAHFVCKINEILQGRHA
jgi:shikimate kinase